MNDFTESPTTVFICLVGATPAVLTESIWALANDAGHPVFPDRVIAITTGMGAVRLRKQFFQNGHWENLKHHLVAKHGDKLSGKLRFGDNGNSIRVFTDADQFRELDDIRSEGDSAAVADFFMELIRGFTSDSETRLVVSIAGGRKSSSALLHSVMTLLGRDHDRITHVLIDDFWIAQPDFLYPGCEGDFKNPDTGEPVDSSSAEITLLDVPFVPLRYLFESETASLSGNFTTLVDRYRSELLEVDPNLELHLDTSRAQISIGEKMIDLSPNEFLIYLHFAKRAIDSAAPVENFAEIADDLTALRDEYLPSDNFDHWSHRVQKDFDPTEDFRKWASAIRAKLGRAGFNPAFQRDAVPRGGRLSIKLQPENIKIS